MNRFVFVLFFIELTVIGINGESLFSIACSNDDQTCTLYKITIDQPSNLAVSNEITKWRQANITDKFGSVVGFKNVKMQYIILTDDCNHHAYLINLTNPTQSPTSLDMKTPCTQPIHVLAGRYLLALGTISNGEGGSSPTSLYEFDPISGHILRGKL